MLCVLIYVKTGCGLRTVVSILGIFEKVLGGTFGKAPCYNSVCYWVLKLGLSVYEEDVPKEKKYGVIIDESIMINEEKLLLVLGFNSEHVEKPLRHKDVTVLGKVMITDEKTQNKLYADTDAVLFTLDNKQETVHRMMEIIEDTPEYLQLKLSARPCAR